MIAVVVDDAPFFPEASWLTTETESLLRPLSTCGELSTIVSAVDDTELILRPFSTCGDVFGSCSPDDLAIRGVI